MPKAQQERGDGDREGDFPIWAGEFRGSHPRNILFIDACMFVLMHFGSVLGPVFHSFWPRILASLT